MKIKNFSAKAVTTGMTFALASLGILASGCAKQQFTVASSTSNEKSPGHFLIPPKVDILLAEDDTGSMSEAYDTVSSEIPDFLKSLDAQNWNYHFATMRLTHSAEIAQVMASKYDANWNPLGLWQAPYPGATPDTVGGNVAASVFSTPDNYQGFIPKDFITNELATSEPGFKNIAQELRAAALGSSGFLRDDAMLVVLVIGNGNDDSDVQYTARPIDGEMVPTQSSLDSSFANYESIFQSIKANQPAALRFYAAVAGTYGAHCLGSYSRVGTRYQKMASALGGQSYDICTTPIGSALEGIAQNLHGIALDFRTRYLFVAQDANPATITVTRYHGGDLSQPETIPQDPNNGWTYEGMVSNVDVNEIDSPTGLVEMNQASGYAIRLHGAAMLVGDDTATVDFKPATLH